MGNLSGHGKHGKHRRFSPPPSVIVGRQSRRPKHTVLRMAAPGAAMARWVFMVAGTCGRP
jgi:hypothetical protein